MPSDLSRTIVSLAGAALLAVLAIGSTDSKKADSAAANQPISDISWRTIDSIYNLKHKETDLRKDELWKQFEGKRVQWTGRVSEISQMFGSVNVQVKMNPDTFTSDVIITLKDGEKSKAARFHKGDIITFTGTLDSWGSIMPISLKNGEIVE